MRQYFDLWYKHGAVVAPVTMAIIEIMIVENLSNLVESIHLSFISLTAVIYRILIVDLMMDN